MMSLLLAIALTTASALATETVTSQTSTVNNTQPSFGPVQTGTPGSLDGFDIVHWSPDEPVNWTDHIAYSYEHWPSASSLTLTAAMIYHLEWRADEGRLATTSIEHIKPNLYLTATGPIREAYEVEIVTITDSFIVTVYSNGDWYAGVLALPLKGILIPRPNHARRTALPEPGLDVELDLPEIYPHEPQPGSRI
ncbi:hypothetical protein BDV19DRAFT_32865 [Aspergillus venezuelensis]